MPLDCCLKLRNLYTHSVNYRELGEAVRSLAVSQDYAKTAMRRWSPIDEDYIDGIARQLVWEYPEHGYILDMEEARRIGLNNVGRLNFAIDDFYWESIVELGQLVDTGLFEDDDMANDEAVTSVTSGGRDENETEALCE